VAVAGGRCRWPLPVAVASGRCRWPLPVAVAGHVVSSKGLCRFIKM
jgi:hypothetical protein